jgi:hypothetical protein
MSMTTREAVAAIPTQMRMLESGLSLRHDPDTSMVESLQLHLVSEHGLAQALHMDKLAAEAAHRRAHHVKDDDHQAQQSHPLIDHRFRPGRVLQCLMSTAEREHHLDRGATG